MELEVKVINISEGRNEAIIRRCPKLYEYSMFMARIYEYKEKTGSLEEGITEAIKYCHNHGILKEYLEIYGSEVLNMLYTEFNIEEAKEVWQAEARAEAHEEGRVEGLVEGREEVLELLSQRLSKEEIEEIKLRLTRTPDK